MEARYGERVKNRDLSLIDIPRDAWEPINKATHTVIPVGYDTETKDGECFLIAYSSRDIEKHARTDKVIDRLRFLTTDHKTNKNERTARFFYNLTYDTQAVTKGMPRSYLESFSRFNKVVYLGYIIEQIPNKRLRITDPNGKTFDYYDLAQYYGYTPLDTLGSERYGAGKAKDDIFDVKNLSPSRYDKDASYKAMLDKYIIQDCNICRRLGEDLSSAASLLFRPKSFFSQAGFSQQYFLENAPRKYYLPPRPVMQAALYAYNGGRFETVRRGTITKATSYDIRSAYPHHARNIPSLDTGDWSVSDKYDPESDISIMRVLAKGKTHVSPLRHSNKGLLYYPTGSMSQWVNKTEYELLKDMGYSLTVEKAYHYRTDSEERPFKFMEDIYRLKEGVEKTDPLYMVYKIIANGFYGKTIQMMPGFDEESGMPTGRWKAGKLFNPVVAMEITANTRCDVVRATMDDQEAVIAYHTDSVISDGKVNLKVGRELGEWDREKHGTITILGSGIYHWWGQENNWSGDADHKSKSKLRGFNKEPLRIEELRTDDVYLKRNISRNQRLKMVLRKNGHFDDYNRIIDNVPRKLNVNFDKKRVWDRQFISANDAIEHEIGSKPYVLNI